MKRAFRILALLLVLITALCVTASAATVYELKNDTSTYGDCIIRPCSANGTKLTFTTAYVDGSETATCVFQGAEKYELKFSPEVTTDDFMVFLLKADETDDTAAVVPKADNLYYIDQAEGANKQTFMIYPSDLPVGKYVLCVSSATKGYQQLGTFRVTENIEEASFTLGDVNMDSSISSADAIQILQHAVKLIKLTGDAAKAADVNFDGTISSADAIKVLQYGVRLIVTF